MKSLRFLLTCVLCANLHADENSYRQEIEPLLTEYCFDCHAEGMKKGDFSMDSFGDLGEHIKDRAHWFSVWSNLRAQIMPPSEEVQPSTKEIRKILNWIETEVFELDPKKPDPGRVTIRRLNRTEYRYAVYDLLGVEYDTTEAFPPDDSGHGFDNIGDVLSISPLLMEKYMKAAEEVVDLALPDDASAQVPRLDIDGGKFKHPEVSSSWVPFSQATKLKLRVPIRHSGTYRFTLQYSIDGATEATTAGANMKFLVNGAQLKEDALGWDQRSRIDLVAETKLQKGNQTIQISLSPTARPQSGEEPLYLNVQRLILQGPMDGKLREYSKGYRMILGNGPVPQGGPDIKAAFARKAMQSFVSRAFRRPVIKSDIDRLVNIVQATDKIPGKSFEDGIKRAIMTCLASPRFLFRIEIQPEPNNPSRIVSLDEYALASRLSFFLWSSVPDDELLSLAYKKQLRANLRGQVQRMLADPKANRLTENFVGQWLQTRDVATINMSTAAILGVKDNALAARLFDPRLRSDMQRETYMLFNHVLRKGRPAEELISANYSYLNGRLAKFYGIGGVYGEQMRLVELSKHPERGGLLTQGSVLMVTSNPNRTSPVKRGLFVLDNLLGTPPPPAPPDVPELETAQEKAGEGVELTMREMMVEHRENPDCRGCHARMDPLGLGLENFDALGRYRERQAGKPIDAAGQLVTGETFNNVASLKKILAEKRKTDFYRAISEKMLTYAIGRGIEMYDTTTIDQLVKHLEKHDGKLVELIHAITVSAPFQMRRGDH